MNKVNTKQYRNKDWLYEHYIIKKLSANTIGKLYNISYNTVLRNLRKFNIKIKKVSDYETSDELRKFRSIKILNWYKHNKHPFLGRKLTKKQIQILVDANKNNKYNYKYDNIKYAAAHLRIQKIKGKPQKCEVCGTTNKNKKYHWASLTKNYLNIEDYKRMCISCHCKYDKLGLNFTKNKRDVIRKPDIKPCFLR